MKNYIKFTRIDKVFALILLLIISTSFFFKIPIENRNIGIKGGVLSIGDRSFYINNEKPFGIKGYQNYNFQGRGKKTFKGSPLYPKILELSSLISLQFGEPPSSKLWNTIIISLSAILAFLINKLIFLNGLLLNNKRMANLSSIIFICCPYTYFFTLTGGITIFTLFGSTLLSFGIIRLINTKIKRENDTLISISIITFSSLWLILIRPTGIIFSVSSISLLLFYCLTNKNLNFYFNKRIKYITIGLLIFIALIVIQQFQYTSEYISAGFESFSFEKSNFLGFPRNLLRETILKLRTSESILSNLGSYLYLFNWRSIDFILGINDIRDSYSNSNELSLLNFSLRIFTGFFYLLPLSGLTFLSLLLKTKRLINSGLLIIIISTTLSIAPSLIGYALSRYYFMFFTPIVLSVALIIDDLLKIKYKDSVYRLKNED